MTANDRLADALRALRKPCLVYNPKTKDCDEVPTGPTVWIPLDSTAVHLSAEDGTGWADYYPEWQPYSYIHPEVERVAAEHGFFAEWVNPGCVAFYPA